MIAKEPIYLYPRCMFVKQNPPRLDTTELNSLSPRTGGMDPRRRITVDCRWRLKICVLFFSCATCSERSQSLSLKGANTISNNFIHKISGCGSELRFLLSWRRNGFSDFSSSKVATGGCSARGRTNQRWCLECAYPQWAGSLLNICVHEDRRLLPT